MSKSNTGTLTIVYKRAVAFSKHRPCQRGNPFETPQSGTACAVAVAVLLLVDIGDAMAKKPNKDRVVAFRLTDEELAAFKEQIEKSGTKPAQFWRELVLSKEPVFVESSKDHERLLFIANKAGNNLNQIAHKLNSAYRRGVVSEQLYLKTLNSLVSVRNLLLVGVNHVDQG
ncbi:plasmid mobilization protein [Pseudomonas fragariae (ex Marin et al. 2024)]|uniref:plasmid mobilization protein n=1 Tax=Pseudomonas fragariae (ex Marin et al. 2024) TaxID=3080056 RepID=UPI003F79D257